jgi:hypothetical protein
MTVDERIEYLLKAQDSREAKRNRLLDLHAQTQKAHRCFMARTEKALKSMARTEHRLTDLEGGSQ